jgi:hypothetical protein
MTSAFSANHNTSSSEQINTHFKLANIWFAKGKWERAIAGYQEVLRLNPEHLQARIHLDYLQRMIGQQAKSSNSQAEIYSKKINLSHQKIFAAHRSGWGYALQALQSLHSEQGILFDGYLESSFLRKNYQLTPDRVPYRQPWVGVLHNPPAMPGWFYYRDSPQSLFAESNWIKSLEHCIGLFCLSDYHAQWLQAQTNIPISSLIHPTEMPDLRFDFERFIANPEKKIIQLGWWLRKLAAIYQLPVPRNNQLNYQKIKLNPAFTMNSDDQLQRLIDKQIEVEQITLDPDFVKNTLDLTHVSNQKYDELLSENIGFIELYDTSANNAVIECIARATPLLINPLPAVIEYLGTDYPLYFNSLAEAAQKVMDTELIRVTHEYLKTCETRCKLSAEYFLESFQKSEVYRLI